jgi:translation initiation factor 6 (eIF-6)
MSAVTVAFACATASDAGALVEPPADAALLAALLELLEPHAVSVSAGTANAIIAVINRIRRLMFLLVLLHSHLQITG